MKKTKKVPELITLSNKSAGINEASEKVRTAINAMLLARGEPVGKLTQDEINQYRSNGYLVFVCSDGSCIVVKKPVPAGE